MSLARPIPHDSDLWEFPPDTGCEIAPRCLECPLPRCKWEVGRAVYGLRLRDINMLERLRNGGTYAGIARVYNIDERSVHRGLARARLYESKVGLSPRPVVRADADGSLDVRVRLHLPAQPKPKHPTRIRDRDWHDRVVILRAWGFTLKMIAHAAGRVDTSTLYHHLREDCRCGLPDRSGRLDRRAEVAA